MDGPVDRNSVKARTTEAIKHHRVQSLPEMSGFLRGLIVVIGPGGRESRPRKLSSAGEAMVEYIHENETDTSLFRFYDDANLVLGEVDAIEEFLEGKARVGGGGALFQHQPPKVFAMDSPLYSPTTQGAFDADRGKLPNWATVAVPPAHGGASKPTIQTPGGTDLLWYTTYTQHSPGGTEHRLHMYGQDAKPSQPPFVVPVSAVGPSITTKLVRALNALKRAESANIDLALLNKWSGKRKGFTPDQNAAMSNTSAKEAALTHFGLPAQTSDWQWLHLIAFTLGGDIGDPQNPNTVANLVAGTAAANGHHLVIENLVKKLILSGKADSVKLTAVAHMIVGSLQVATRIDYAIKVSRSGKQDDHGFYVIDTVNPSQSAGGDLGVLWARYSQ